MKIAILYDSKFGNTKQVTEFLADQLNSSGYEVKSFRTKKTVPSELVAFEPEAILVGSPTHGKAPARTLKKYLKKLAKLLKESSSVKIKKGATFNCFGGDNVCHQIAEKVREAIPNIELHDTSLPLQVLGWKGPLPNNWMDLATTFLKGLLPFLA